MSLYTLPSLTEEKFYNYITANYSGSYNVYKSFKINPDLALPAIMIKAGKFTEKDDLTNTSVYEGNLTFFVETQVDDVEDALTTHDNTVAAIADAMSNLDALFNAINQSSGSYHLHFIHNSGFEQDTDGRAFRSKLDYAIYCQTLAY